MFEIKELRTEYSKTFDIGNKRRQIRASAVPMHVLNNNKFENIEVKFIDNKIRTGFYNIDLLSKSIGFKFIDRITNNFIQVELDNSEYFNPKIEKNSVLWEEVSPGVDIKFVFDNYRARIYRILKNDSALKIAIWKITDDNNKKEALFKPIFFGYDSNFLETVHNIDISEKKNGVYTVTDTFSGKVIVRRGKKRIKEELDAVYPVIIDPSVDVSISTSADDGLAYKGTSGTNISTSFNNIVSNCQIVEASLTTGFKYHVKSYTRFNSITIPKNSNILSAIIKVQISYGTGVNPVPVIVKAKNLNNPSAPTTFSQVYSPATLASNIITTDITHTGFTEYSKEINVKDIVQELVNLYDYTNQSMLFFFNTNALGIGETIKQIQWFSYDRAEIIPELIIEYDTALNINVSDVITLTENNNLLEIDFINVSDSITITESVTVQNTNLGNISLSDSITVTENNTVNLTSFISINDVVTITESVSVQNLTLTLSVNDSISVSESLIANLTSFINNSETVTLTESVSVINTDLGNISISDTITLTESITLLEIDLISLSDTVTVSENLTVSNLLLSININEALSLSETVALNNIFNINVNDSINLIESVTLNLLSFVDVNESVTLTENLSNIITFFISVLDLILIEENIDILNTVFINVNDSVSVNENIIITNIFLNLTVSDDILINEFAVTNSTNNLFISATDDIVIIESLIINNLNLGLITVNEQLNINDNIVLNNDLGAISISDSIALIETLSLEEFLNLFSFDNVLLTESILSNLSIEFSVFEDITLQEYLSIENHLSNLSVFDIVYIEELYSVLQELNTYFISVSDSVDINDFLIFVVGISNKQYIVYLKSRIANSISLNSKINPFIKLDSKINNNIKLNSKSQSQVKLASKSDNQIKLSSKIGKQ